MQKMSRSFALIVVLALLFSGTYGLASASRSTAALASPPRGPQVALTSTTVLLETFDGSTLPTGWTVDNFGASTGWRFDNPADRSNDTGGSDNFAIADDDYVGGVPMTTSLTTPALNFSTYAWVTLQFNTSYRQSDAADEVAQVEVSLNGTTWTEVWTAAEELYGEPVQIDLSTIAAHQASVRVRFLYQNAVAAQYWAIDDVEVIGDITPPPVPTPVPTTPTPVATPPSPSGLHQTGSTLTTITLAWNTVANVTGYRLERSADGVTGWQTVGETAAGNSSFTNTALHCGKTYYYRLRSLSEGGVSLFSPSATASTAACGAAPAAPSALTASNVDMAEINLTWTDNSNNEDGFVIERSPNGSTAWEKLDTTGANIAAFTDDDLACGTPYSYRVQAVSDNGDSSYATLTTATAACPTGNGLSEAFETGILPTGWVISGTQWYFTPLLNMTNETGGKGKFATGSPADFGPVAFDSTLRSPILDLSGMAQVVLSFKTSYWPAVGDAADVDVSTNGGSSWATVWHQAGTAVKDEVRLNLTAQLANHANVAIRFRYHTSNNATYWQLDDVELTGHATTINAPDAPTDLIQADTDEGSISLEWTDNSDNEDGFEIERSLDDGVSWEPIDETGDEVAAFTDDELACDSTFAYRVRAFNDGGESAYTTLNPATTSPCDAQPTAPANLAVDSVTESAVMLTWDDTSNNEAGFKLDVSLDLGQTWTADVGEADEDETTYEDDAGLCGATLMYRVWAYNDEGRSGYSNPISATLAACAAPIAPQALTATVEPDDSVGLTWDYGEASFSEVYFEIQRSLDGVAWSNLFETEEDVTDYQDYEVACNTGYSYRLRAARRSVSGPTYSAYTDPVRVRTLPCAILTETFDEAGVPAGWSVVTNNSIANKPGWLFNDPGSAGNNTGSDGGFATADRYQSGTANSWEMNTELRMPPLNLSAYTSAKLTFKTDFATAVNATAQVEASSNNGVTWETLFRTTANLQTEDDKVVTVNLSPYAGRANVLVRFNYTGATNGRWQIDEVQVRGARGDGVAPTAPTGVNRAGGSETAIVLAWSDPNMPKAGASVERLVGQVWQVAGRAGTGITSYTDNSLLCGTTYQYRLRAANAAGFSAYTTAASFQTAACAATPAAPVNLAKAGAQPTTITLEWGDASANEQGFEVERSQSGDSWLKVAALGPNSESFTSAGLVCGTPYRFRVRAFNAKGVSPYSEEVWATTAACAAGTAPNAPTGLNATNVTVTGLTLNWTDASNNEAGFRIERSANQRDWVLIGSTAGTMTFVDSGLDCAQPYAYRVSAYNDAGTSTVASITVNTNACGSVPAAPAGLRAVISTTNSIGLAWNAVTGAERFDLERSENGQTGWVRVTSLSGNVLVYTDDALACGNTYFYRVRAYKASTGPSAWSDTRGMAIAACATGLRYRPSGVTAAEKCNTPADGSIVLIDTPADPEANVYRVLLEITSPVITSTDQGCDVSGMMHLVLHSNDVTDVPIAGTVNQDDEFVSTSIDNFSLMIAGIRLYTDEPWVDLNLPPLASLEKAPVFNDGQLKMNTTYLGLPEEFGVPSIPLLKGPVISKKGVDFGAKIGLPALPLVNKVIASSVEDKAKLFQLAKLQAELKFTARGFEFKVEGGLKLPKLDSSAANPVSAATNLASPEVGNAPAAGATPGCDEISVTGSVYVNESTGEATLEFNTPAGPDGYPSWANIGGKVGVAVQCSPGIQLGPYPVIYLSGARGEIALGGEDTSLALGVTFSWTPISIISTILPQYDVDAKIAALPQFSIEGTGAIRLFKIWKFEEVGFKFTDEPRMTLKGKIDMILAFGTSQLDMWWSGIKRQGILPIYEQEEDPEPHISGTGVVQIGLKSGQWVNQDLGKIPCGLNNTKTQIQQSIETPIKEVLQKVPVVTKIFDFSQNLASWFTPPGGQVYRPSVPAWSISGALNWVVNTAKAVAPEVVQKVEEVIAKVPVPTCPDGQILGTNGICFNPTWQPLTTNKIIQAIEANEKQCPAELKIPADDLIFYDQKVDFGVTRLSDGRTVWGYTGIMTDSMNQTAGVLISVEADEEGNYQTKISLKNGDQYTSVTSDNIQAVMAAQAANRPVPAELQNINVVADDQVIIRALNYTPAPQALRPEDVITTTNVITTSDTRFQVTSVNNFTMTLVDPNGNPVTPDVHSGYNVVYTNTVTYQPAYTLTAGYPHWRYFPASSDESLYDVKLIGGDVITLAEHLGVNSGYMDAPTGTKILNIVPNGSAPIPVVVTFDQVDTDYTVFMFGPSPDDMVQVVDDNSVPPLGQGRVRFVNGISPRNTVAVDVYVDDHQVANNLAYRGISSYLDLPLGQHRLEIRNSQTNDTLMAADTLDIGEGTIYTVQFSELDAKSDAQTGPALGHSLFLRWNQIPDKQYIPLHLQAYGIDQALNGAWQVSLTGPITETGWGLVVMGLRTPPIVSDFVIDGTATDLTDVPASLTVKSDRIPTILSFYANPDAISRTFTITNDEGLTHDVVVPVYQGQPLQVITITNPALLNGTQAIQAALDLSGQESAGYHVYVEVDDRYNVPVDVYATVNTGLKAMTAHPAYVNVSAAGYDALAALNSAGVFNVNQHATFTPDLLAGVIITPELNATTSEWDTSTDTWVSGEQVPLRVSWTTAFHPDATDQVIKLEQLQSDSTYTETERDYVKMDGDPVLDANGHTLALISAMDFVDVSPDETYRISVGLYDEESDTAIWAPATIVTIPSGSIGLTWQPVSLTVQYSPDTDYGMVEAALTLTKTADLFYDVDYDFDYTDLPDGIMAEILSSPEELVAKLSGARHMARTATLLKTGQQAESIPIAIYAEDTVPDGTYVLPVIAYAGDEVQLAEITFTVQQPVYSVSLSVDQTETGKPGQTVEYTYILTNTGPTADTYYLWAMNENDWTVSLSSTAGTWDDDFEVLVIENLATGQAAAIKVSVVVGQNAATGQLIATDLIAESDSDAEVYAVATSWTQVGTHSLYLPTIRR